jgi:hypothetical protein
MARYPFEVTKMAEHYFTTSLDNETTLSIAPLTNRRITLSGQEIEDTSGYFLYETCKSSEPNEVKIIAKVLSEDAAFQLSRMLRME